MSSTNSKPISKPIAIVYCRLSRIADSRVMSLDSQEFAIKNWLESNNINVFKTLKEVGSAFKPFKGKKTVSDLKRILSSCKDKTLVVFEANRLSRNVYNFREIYNICKKNRHNIAIVNINMIFNYNISSNYEILYKMIADAQEESASMGRRISRTAAYKKSRETEWGKMRNELDEIIDNPMELKVNKLIKLLNTTKSPVLEIKKLVEDLRTNVDAEPFELVYYDDDGKDKEFGGLTPMGMSVDNIVETFKIYGIRKRRAQWYAKDIRSILITNRVKNNYTLDNLATSMRHNSLTSQNRAQNVLEDKKDVSELDWIAVWYDPKIGLPPNVITPKDMELPNKPMTIYIPRK
jgi:DNA invertase Pin-like site-specific DNA recombinase